MTKTTIEIPDPLFRKAKVRATKEGLSMGELFIRALQEAVKMPATSAKTKRVDFPLICASQNAPRLTDEQVAAALYTEEGLI